MKKWNKNEFPILEKMWKDETKDVLVKYFGRSWKSICRKAETLRFKRPRMPHTLCFEGKEPDWLIGEMLGDGHISKCGQYCHTSKYLDYTLFLENKFKSIDIFFKYWKNSTYDKRTKKTYHRYLSKTRCVFKDFRSRWYPYGKKIIPQDICLTDEVVYHWILGDGSISNETFRLFTMGFDIDSIHIARSKLNDYGLATNINKDGNLYIKKNLSNMKKTKQFVREFDPPQCYQYKFERLKKWSGAIPH